MAAHARTRHSSLECDITLESLHNFDYILVFDTPWYAAIFCHLLPWCFRGSSMIRGTCGWPNSRSALSTLQRGDRRTTSFGTTSWRASPCASSSRASEAISFNTGRAAERAATRLVSTALGLL